MGSQNGNKGDNFDFDKQYLSLEKGYTVLNTIFNAKIIAVFQYYLYVKCSSAGSGIRNSEVLPT